MNIPDNIKYILERIYKSEKEWKALYMAVWRYSGHIETLFANPESFRIQDFRELKAILGTPSGTAKAITVIWEPQEKLENGIVELELPASKKPYLKYTIAELRLILASRDKGFTLSHLQTLFSLLEVLTTEVSDEVLKSRKDMGYWKNMKPFLKNTIKLPEPTINELYLAKKTRDCFIHNSSKIDYKGEWIEAYKIARGTTPSANRGDELEVGLVNIFHQVEDWHDLIVGVAKTIEYKIAQLFEA